MAIAPESSALVLGGGGVTGVGWEMGMLAGLLDAGVDLSSADLLVGTSAGAAVAAQVGSGLPLAELYQRQLAPPLGEIRASLGGWTMARLVFWMMVERDPQRFGARMGSLALAAKTDDEAARRAAIASRLPLDAWPARALQLTAVNAVTGEFRVFDRASGVSLIDAVSASCAVPGVWPPVTIGADRWIDGGMRSAANADLAAGRARVVVLAPIDVGFGVMVSASRQVQALREAGSDAVIVSPDAEARAAIGRNSLDPRKRAAAAESGYRQARAAAPRVAAVWG